MIPISGVDTNCVTRAAKLLNRALDPDAEHSFRFQELRQLLRILGFQERRVRGSHHVMVRSDLREIVNIQPRKDGTAKPYQMRQVRSLILRYGLHLHLDRGAERDV